MKKIILIALQLSITSFAFSQDLLTKKTGEDIKAKVLEVTQDEVKYKKYDSQSGPTYSIKKSELILIRYQDGTKDIFNENVNEKANNSDDEMAKQGRIDANSYYKGKNSGANWTGATTVLFSPLIGAVPAIICSSNEPSDENLNYKSKELMKNDAYSSSYKEQAHKIKKRKIWTSFGIGSGAWLLLLILLGSSGG